VFTARYGLYIPPCLTFTNSTFCPHSVFMCFVWISEQTAIICLYSINWLVFITHSVMIRLRTDQMCTYLFVHYVIRYLKTRMWKRFSSQCSPTSRYQKCESVLKVPRLCPLVLLVRATCRWRRVWRIGGMVLTGETEVLGEKPVTMTLCPRRIPQGLAWDRSHVSPVWRQITLRYM
jgi:hypothetical protein